MHTSCFSCDLPEETWRSTVKSKHIRTPSCTLIPKSILGSLARNDVAQKTFLLNNKLRDTFSVKSVCLGHSLLSPFTAAPQLFSMKELRQLRLLTRTLASGHRLGPWLSSRKSENTLMISLAEIKSVNRHQARIKLAFRSKLPVPRFAQLAV